MRTKDAGAIIIAMKQAAEETNIDYANEKIATARIKMEHIQKQLAHAENDQTPQITFSEAVAAVKEIKEAIIQEPLTATMTAKRISTEDGQRTVKRSRIEELKGRTRCRVCSKVGNWYKDNPEYVRNGNQETT